MNHSIKIVLLAAGVVGAIFESTRRYRRICRFIDLQVSMNELLIEFLDRQLQTEFDEKFDDIIEDFDD